ncbi:hypothetical protein ACQP1W_44655 [Spirillospora sp. CA-255316]
MGADLLLVARGQDALDQIAAGRFEAAIERPRPGERPVSYLARRAGSELG